jgi:pyruvate,orthophosphate dikinase
MQDTEFTIEEGRLYMLQTRSAKRPAQAAVRFAVDAVEEGLLTKAEAIATIDAASLDALLHPTFDPTPSTGARAGGRGLARRRQGRDRVHGAGGGCAAADGTDVILVRPFTEAEDVAGFHAAKGILTSEGGKASHAALVARGMGRPAVTGRPRSTSTCTPARCGWARLVLHRGDLIAIDGGTGAITTEDVPLVEARVDERFETVLTLVRRAAATRRPRQRRHPGGRRRAHRFGAEGIGLCRTEHMFMAPERQPLMRAMIMAEDDAGRRGALDQLLPLQQRDFEGCSRRWRASRSRSACSTRRCTSSCPTASSCTRRSCAPASRRSPNWPSSSTSSS